MKATKAGQTIGTALGSFSGHEGTVLVFVNLGYFDPSPGVQGSSSNFEELNVSGNAALNRLRVNNVTVDGSIGVAGDLRVAGNTNVGQITIDGHIVTQGNAPSITLQNGSGEGATASLSGNDTSGVVSITLGNDATADKLIKITFSTHFNGDPRIVVTPVGRESAKALPYVDYANNTEMTLGVAQVPTQGTTLKYTYQIMQ
jgi:hypothetical protein